MATEQSVLIDFEGNGPKKEEAQKKVLIQEDSYNFKISRVDKIETKAYKDPTKKETKLVFICELSEAKNKDNGMQLSHFVTPKITKASKESKGKGYSNSKLYDLLVDLGLLEVAKSEAESIQNIDGLLVFLNKEIANKTVRAKVKTVNANTDNAYSTVEKILRFVGEK